MVGTMIMAGKNFSACTGRDDVMMSHPGMTNFVQSCDPECARYQKQDNDDPCEPRLELTVPSERDSEQCRQRFAKQDPLGANHSTKRCIRHGQQPIPVMI